MAQINTAQAKKEFSALLKRVEKGERIIIASRNQPIAEMRPLTRRLHKKARPYGLCANEFRVPANFNDPLPKEILESFYPKK
ncbi:MAG: type II toxin-antitoxin system prevent-host-death family antitoxin [Deltaproteobacteria bacterium]|nr:type II toxin-antitoxin system prevent-host-death family antitoxin [Deltaproteobacteria bacterium]